MCRPRAWIVRMMTWFGSYARLNGFAIVTKDADYNNLSVMQG